MVNIMDGIETYEEEPNGSDYDPDRNILDQIDDELDEQRGCYVGSSIKRQ